MDANDLRVLVPYLENLKAVFAKLLYYLCLLEQWCNRLRDEARAAREVKTFSNSPFCCQPDNV